MTDDRPYRIKARKKALNAPSPPVKDLGDKVHVRRGRSAHRLLTAMQREASNGWPELIPYVWRGRPPSHPGLCDECGMLASACRCEPKGGEVQ